MEGEGPAGLQGWPAYACLSAWLGWWQDVCVQVRTFTQHMLRTGGHASVAIKVPSLSCTSCACMCGRCVHPSVRPYADVCMKCMCRMGGMRASHVGVSGGTAGFTTISVASFRSGGGADGSSGKSSM